jgi:hypothetical protein
VRCLRGWAAWLAGAVAPCPEVRDTRSRSAAAATAALAGAPEPEAEPEPATNGSDEWLIKHGKKSVRQQEVGSTAASEPETAISALFRGKMVSSVSRSGAPVSRTVQPFAVLGLHIVPEQVGRGSKQGPRMGAAGAPSIAVRSAAQRSEGSRGGPPVPARSFRPARSPRLPCRHRCAAWPTR